MLKLQQTWYHLNETPNHNSYTRQISQVADFFTNEQFLYLDLVEFTELKIKSRNPSQEIGFIEKDGTIIANLGKIREFPAAQTFQTNPLFHVKLQIDYLEKNALFIRKKPFQTGYNTSFSLKGKFQPEFTINIPKGLKIHGKNSSEYLQAYQYKSMEMELCQLEADTIKTIYGIYEPDEWKEKSLYSAEIDDKFYWRIIKIFSPKEGDLGFKIILGINLSVEVIQFDLPVVSPKDNANSYTFIINSESYQRITKTPEMCLLTTDFGYAVKNEKQFFLFPFFGGLLLAIMSLLLMFSDFNEFNMTIPLSLLIITLSYLGLFFEFSLVKGYEIPYKNAIYYLILLSFFLNFIIFLFGSIPQAKPWLGNLLVEIVKMSISN
ncbi:MAG TPA: hypothetical protein HA271_05670 [Methanobacterium subterraneum]|uniref:Uncharacterized protein n=1 Tax=Methanobacterium subterraneum TaxID=59277 RepID=A0A7J4TM57_9EURY|nr:hypothetical protein [Methanobacterium subterraneum]